MAILVAATCSAQSTEEVAAVVKFQKVYNAHQPDSFYNMLSARGQGMMSEDKIRVMFKQLYTGFGALTDYEFIRQEGAVSMFKGVFAEKTMTLLVSVNSDNKLETFRFAPFVPLTEKSNIELKTPTGIIYGALVIPPGQKKVPVVLILAGSGPTDRNGNQPGGVATNAYKMLADSLSKHGIASLRYDKRGIGESAEASKSEESLRFDDLINDAAGYIKMLKADSRFSRVIVMGHSEGSLIGMVAAEREHAAAFISLAGAGERADNVLVKQSGMQSEQLAKGVRIAFDSLLKGYTVVAPPPALAITIFRPSVQPFLRSWLQYDPAKEIKKLQQPVLILQGTTDIQVGVADAESLKKANKKAQLQIIEGMNHVLKTAPADRQKNMATYSNPDLPLDDKLVPAITTFIKQQQK